MKCAVPLNINLRRKKISAREVVLRNAMRETEANFRPLNGGKDDVCRAVKTIDAMESLKALPVKV